MRIFLQTRQIKRKKEKKIHYKIRLIKLDEGRDEYHLTRLLISKIKLGETNRSHHRDNEVIFLHRPTNQPTNIPNCSIYSQLFTFLSPAHTISTIPLLYPHLEGRAKYVQNGRAKQILETTHRSNGSVTRRYQASTRQISRGISFFSLFFPSLPSSPRIKLA